MFLINNYIVSVSTLDYIKGYRDIDKFIVFCKECNKYGNSWACPPYNFDTTGHILKYEIVYIFGTKISIDENIRSGCVNTEKSKQLGSQIMAMVRKELDKQLLELEEIYPDSKAFFAGNCHICEKEYCTRITGTPCRYPDKIRHSLESFGFDIGKTAGELLNIELRWSEDGMLPEYLTLVSGLFTNHKIDNIGNYFKEK